MKKKKSDIKKIALLGLATGLLMTTQGAASEANSGVNLNDGQQILAKCGKNCNARTNCSGKQGGRGSCAGRSNCSGRKSCSGRSNCSGRKSCSARSSCSGIIADAYEDQQQQLKEGSITEGQLLQQLDPVGKATYNSLDPEHKQLALELANQSCQGHNSCKGKNACKTENNSCAGKGGCRGQSKCNFKDKNKAVKVAQQKMLEKRNESSNSSNFAPKYYYNY